MSFFLYLPKVCPIFFMTAINNRDKYGNEKNGGIFNERMMSDFGLSE